MTDCEPGRPLPTIDMLNAPFWEAAHDGRLVVQQCAICGGHEWTPQLVCSACLSGTLVWTPVSGQGEIYALTIVRAMQVEAMPPPYVVAIVLLDEGVHMLTNIVDADPQSVRIGQRVEIAFVQERAGISLPCFRPIGNDAGIDSPLRSSAGGGP
ncbi:OB-fold domain-containing protein (plasmid) [Rhizorhabdus wittichii]|jgi:uncharacterized OB-fold protein|uniref:OB-fold domain-containing protein n=1 Tax=Rhizorhabdus wittichii TaxID=160791 RepID=A0A975HGX3_9SPHN|nr:OB-fold domain-containing protein [Rhizorhabdus wittichii]QTH25006.1 OB-fold domain-containing protein [Rhizorhabdus wittichii]